MVRVDELRARVRQRYDQLGMPFWTDPHPQRDPCAEEYSRFTDPERYRIVHARARVWSEILSELPGVGVEALAPAPLDAEGRRGRFDRGVRLTSSGAGTLPLFLLERDQPVSESGAHQAALHVSVDQPEFHIDVQPDCGCDACDSGSQDLLDAIDAAICVVGGPFVALRGDGWYARWYPDPAAPEEDMFRSDGPAPNHRQLMPWFRQLAAGEKVDLPPRTRSLVGRAWFD